MNGKQLKEFVVEKGGIEETINMVGDLKNFLISPPQQLVILVLARVNTPKTFQEINLTIREKNVAYRIHYATLGSLIYNKYISEEFKKYQITEEGKKLAEWIKNAPHKDSIDTK